MDIDAAVLKNALKAFEPAVIYLFGSGAAGQCRSDSDLDLAFLPTKTPCDPQAVFDAAQVLAIALGRDVDLIDLSSVGDVLRVQVLRSGKRVIVADPSVMHEFEMLTLSNYARLNEERREVLELAGVS